MALQVSNINFISKENTTNLWVAWIMWGYQELQTQKDIEDSSDSCSKKFTCAIICYPIYFNNFFLLNATL